MLATSFVTDTSLSPQARLKPVPAAEVRLADSFWAPRRMINAQVTLPAQYRILEETGRLDNFRRVSGRKSVPFRGFFFNDSDVYKWLEAVAWSQPGDENVELARQAESVIADITAAQSPDGYLNTYFDADKTGQRWNNLRDDHELYCAGHLIQAAIAWRRCSRALPPQVVEGLFTAARRLADHIGTVFGPGGRPGVPGHPEIELALVELYRETRQADYLRQAQAFLDQRGRGVIGGRSYHLDHLPFREMDRLVGHAVRGLYLCAGAADLLLESGDVDLEKALLRLWERMTARQMYVSGGTGSRHDGEAFGEDWELPNATAYAETCAAVASVMWNWRMLQRSGDARFADMLELALYNGALAGLSLDGLSYFYENPLESGGEYRRKSWFDCACCPTNIVRLLGALPGYFYSLSNEEDRPGVWAHLYAQNSAALQLPGGQTVRLVQSTRFPWEGQAELEVQDEADFNLYLRLPGWCSEPQIELNGRVVDLPMRPGGYACLERHWHSGDVVRVCLPMPPRRVECHPYVAENRGRVALMRGPLLYCLETADQPEAARADLRDLVLPPEASLSVEYQPGLLNQVAVIHIDGQIDPPGTEWQTAGLYRPATRRASGAERVPTQLAAIPYYAWANRTPGQMLVWVRQE